MRLACKIENSAELLWGVEVGNTRLGVCGLGRGTRSLEGDKVVPVWRKATHQRLGTMAK